MLIVYFNFTQEYMYIYEHTYIFDYISILKNLTPEVIRKDM